ncbi:DNA primase subunit pri2 [Tilletia horrida]|uniref:DNA primase subunit pri2 n=1 Tax=Tilletia horrida TaxID=155126 RepID=A0AAN6GIB1_9BASI|nr:DNA primase subunit pri2 [Tilletia horrida]KAK0566432.1 DNA primase subunit pri2 [Tilletia horrida]
MHRAGHSNRPFASERAATAGSPATPGPSGLSAGGVKGTPASAGVAFRHKNERYPHRLSFYNLPPTQEITLWQFETWAIDRLRVLADIESSQARNRTYAEMKDLVTATAKTYLPLNSRTANNQPLQKEREKDHVSHYVLRLAFCRSEELRRRFAKTETTLFRMRFESDDTLERESFLKTLNIEWERVSDQEKERLAPQLKSVSSWSGTNFAQESYFKVHWTKVLDLVEKRKVLLVNGHAYVPSREQATLVVAEFHNQLLAALEQTARALPRLNEDDRLLPVLEHLSMGFLAGISSDYGAGGGAGGIGAELGEALRADMVEGLVRAHAPMCMRHLQETLTEKKHLKHFGRLQYNLFLKEMGLPIEEALVFWRRSFASMTDDKFNKEHKYNIRHGYGLEGRRMNYPAKSCARILTQDQPGPQDSHGCPFRHFSPQNLSAGLSSMYGIPAADQAEILSAVKAGHYHVGCTRLFELTHKKYGVKRGGGVDGKGESVSHPNRYFERSFALSRENGTMDVDVDVDTEDFVRFEVKAEGARGVAATTRAKKAEEDNGEIGDEELDALVAQHESAAAAATSSASTATKDVKMDVDEDGIDADAEAALFEAMDAAGGA